ncbi:MAG: S41 family peptidase [Elusimicrobia bacterium]|nr:S41 family peptidase [Elusimicrobiota bacterium]
MPHPIKLSSPQSVALSLMRHNTAQPRLARAPLPLALAVSTFFPSAALGLDLAQTQRLFDAKKSAAGVSSLPAALPLHFSGWKIGRSFQKLISIEQPISSTVTATMDQMMEEIRQEHPELTEQKLRDAAINGMLQELDPHSFFMDPRASQRWEENINGAGLEGIGVAVEKPDGEYPLVRYAIPGSPGFEAGIRQGDRVIAVSGEDVKNLSLTATVDRIRGPAGTPVQISVLFKNSPDGGPKNINLSRRHVDVPVIYSKIIAPGVGYINFRHFEKSLGAAFEQRLDAMARYGMERLIIDLRDNPGGLLSEVTDIASLFLEKGKLITTFRHKNSSEDHLSSGGRYVSLPFVILVNHGSASASELFSGAMQDHGRAKLIGSQTFGKGISQQDFTDEPEAGYSVHLTTARYYLPSGRSIDSRLHKQGGLTPDIEVNVDEATEAKIAEDRLLRIMKQPPEEAATDADLETALRYFQPSN